MAGESQRDRRKAAPSDDCPTQSPTPAIDGPPPAGLAWIHALAQEWETEVSLLRYPRGLYEATLRK
jgi:hypothetical protein